MRRNAKTHAHVEIVTTISKPQSPCPARARSVHRLGLENNWHAELRLHLHTYGGGGTAHRAQLRAHCGLLGLAIDWELPTWDMSRWEFHAAQFQARNTTEHLRWRAAAHEFEPREAETLARVEQIVCKSRSLAADDPAIHRAAVVYDAMLAATRDGEQTIPALLRDEVRDAANECDVSIPGLNAAVPGARHAAIMATRAKIATRNSANGGA